jgi:hypothetical protein
LKEGEKVRGGPGNTKGKHYGTIYLLFDCFRGKLGKKEKERIVMVVALLADLSASNAEFKG